MEYFELFGMYGMKYARPVLRTRRSNLEAFHGPGRCVGGNRGRTELELPRGKVMMSRPWSTHSVTGIHFVLVLVLVLTVVLVVFLSRHSTPDARR